MVHRTNAVNVTAHTYISSSQRITFTFIHFFIATISATTLLIGFYESMF
jgi:hypothetical protein